MKTRINVLIGYRPVHVPHSSGGTGHHVRRWYWQVSEGEIPWHSVYDVVMLQPMLEVIRMDIDEDHGII